MLKRLIGVITVRNNWAVQSIGFERYLPLGRPEVLAENYDQWQLDEIMLIDIDATRNGNGPNFEVLNRIAAKKIMTPISYVGGIRNVKDALSIVASGADRLGMDSLFENDFSQTIAISEAVGQQAIIRVQPVVLKDLGVHAFDYINKRCRRSIDLGRVKEESKVFSEYMIVDVANEGGDKAFCESVLEPFLKQSLQLVCFGGITSKRQVSSLFELDCVSAVAVGNSLSYKEIANKALAPSSLVNISRATSFGATTRGARDW